MRCTRYSVARSGAAARRTLEPIAQGRRWRGSSLSRAELKVYFSVLLDVPTNHLGARLNVTFFSNVFAPSLSHSFPAFLAQFLLDSGSAQRHRALAIISIYFGII